MIEYQNITRRQQQKEDTRRVILDAAYALFGERGYGQTTMRALARQAGVGLGTIFKHFPDKPSLLVAAYQEDLGKIIAEVVKSMPEVGIKKQLLHITKGIYGFYGTDPSFSRDLIKEALFLKGPHGELLDNQLVAFLKEVAALFQKAIEKGELPGDTDAQEAALAFGAFYFGGLIMGLKQPAFDTEKQLKLVETMIDNHFFAGKG
jgi:AcrR family transcriptional regulator